MWDTIGDEEPPGSRPDAPPQLDRIRATPGPSLRLVGLLVARRFRVTGILGRGGSAIVTEAIDELTGRRVALKLLPRVGGNPTARQRVQREAIAMRSLDHPGLVRFLDAGPFDDGGQYIAMELVEGPTLRDVIRSGEHREPARAFTLLAGIADALEHIHGAGLVHRDVKPENVVVDARGATRLIDLGIAFVGGAKARRITSDDLVVGSPTYLPPEAIGGAAPTPAWDVYALGVVFFELVTGRSPFRGTALDAFHQKQSEPAPSLGSITGTTYSPELEAVVARALSRRVEERPSSPLAFVGELRRAIAGAAGRR